MRSWQQPHSSASLEPDGMKKLISKESSLKQFKTEHLSGTFYRFNNSKYKSQDTSQLINN